LPRRTGSKLEGTGIGKEASEEKTGHFLHLATISAIVQREETRSFGRDQSEFLLDVAQRTLFQHHELELIGGRRLLYHLPVAAGIACHLVCGCVCVSVYS
jgi:hypothetical protein